MNDGADDSDRIERMLSEIDDTDLDLMEPPPAIWAGIEAAVAVAPPNQPPSREPVRAVSVDYLIDAHDVVTEVGGAWAEFAAENDGSALAELGSDRTLWDSIDRPELRELWQLVVERVRRLQTPAEVPFRCDAPHARRWFEMTVSPAPAGGVRFRSVLVFEERRPRVALLDPHTERDLGAAPVLLCGWCCRGQLGDSWVAVEDLVVAERLLERDTLPALANGICAACRGEMSAELLVPAATGDASA